MAEQNGKKRFSVDHCGIIFFQCDHKENPLTEEQLFPLTNGLGEKTMFGAITGWPGAVYLKVDNAPRGVVITRFTAPLPAPVWTIPFGPATLRREINESPLRLLKLLEVRDIWFPKTSTFGNLEDGKFFYFPKATRFFPETGREHGVFWKNGRHLFRIPWNLKKDQLGHYWRLENGQLSRTLVQPIELEWEFVTIKKEDWQEYHD